MKVFIAGATGVIGHRVVEMLVDGGHEVTATGRTPAKLDALARTGARTMPLDITDAAAARRALAGHDALINVATAVPRSNRALLPGAWRATANLRRVGAATLAAAAIETGVRRMIQESFAPIYEAGGDRWLDEDSPVRAARYNRTVLDAEAAARTVTNAGGAGVVLRFGFFYGPDSEFSADMARSVRRGWAPVFGGPAGFMSSVSHDDAARAVVAALAVPPGTYNVVDDEPLRRRDFFDAIAEALGVPPPRFLPRWTRFLAGSLGEAVARSQRISNRRLRAAAPGWVPRFASARDGWRAFASAFDSVR